MCSGDSQYHGEDSHPRRGLLFLLYKKVYKDAFVLHDETSEDPYELEEIQELVDTYRQELMMGECAGSFND